MSPKAAGLAVKAGYKNVQAFISGMPAWKKAKGLLSVKSGWVAKNLAPHVVIVDARSKAAYAKGHIKGAYAFDSIQLKKSLRGLKSKGAPVVVYGDGMKDADSARITIIKKKYKSVAVLDGGLKAWTQKGLPTAKGAAPKKAKIAYVKKLVPGAVKIAEFKKIATKGGAIILDVRTAAERAKGAIKGSVHIPLDQLKANLTKLNKKDKIILHCASGVRAGTGYEIMKAAGFSKTVFLDARISIKKKGSFKIN
jgi:rhodanese-related sulfurtransferase